MRTVMRTLLATTLVGAGFLAGATLPAIRAHDGAPEPDGSRGMMSGGMMSGGMMGGGSGSAMHEESGDMMGMMQQMSRMMKRCNDMMESHDHPGKDAAEGSKPAG